MSQHKFSKKVFSAEKKKEGIFRPFKKKKKPKSANK